MMMVNEAEEDAVAGLCSRILKSEPPHGDPKCGCAICMLPRGGGWGELQIAERIRWMGAGVHRAMRSLGDFVMMGLVSNLPGPGTVTQWVPEKAAPPSGYLGGRATVTGIDRGVASGAQGAETVKLPGEDVEDEDDDFLSEEKPWYPHPRALRYRSAQSRDYAIRRVAMMRTVRHQIPLCKEVRGEFDLYVSAGIERMFRPTHLLISTPENIDIMGLVFGNLICLDGPLDAASFWMPNDQAALAAWDAEAEMAMMERCHINSYVLDVGLNVRLHIAFRGSSFLPKFPFQFRAFLLGTAIE